MIQSLKYHINPAKIFSWCIVIFLCSGLIKSFFKFIGANIFYDITAITGLLIIGLVFILNKGIQRKHLTAFYLLFTLTTWILFTSTYSSSDEYFLIKLLKFGQIWVSFLSGYFIISMGLERYFFIRMVVISTILGILYTFGIIYAALSRGEWGEIIASYLEVSLLCSFSLTALIVFNKSIFKTPLLIFLIFTCATILLGNGARGGIIFTTLSLIAYALTNTKNLKNILFGVTVVTILTILGYIYSPEIKLLFDRSFFRLSFFFGVDKGDSITDRFELISFTIDKVAQSPIFGYGFGSFSEEYIGVDGRYYPHNIFLEILFELGLIGLVFFALFLLTLFIRLDLKKAACYVILALPPFFNSLKSLELTEHRLLFFCFGLFLCLSNNKIISNNKLILKPKTKKYN